MVEDSGLYILRVSNEIGNTQTSANILVKGKKIDLSFTLNRD